MARTAPRPCVSRFSDRRHDGPPGHDPADRPHRPRRRAGRRGFAADLCHRLFPDDRPPSIPPRDAPGVRPMSRTKSGANAPETQPQADGNGHLDATSSVLRRHAEEQFAEELEALAKADTKPRPPQWKLSPWAVSTYLLGGKLDDGFAITPKYIGNRRLMEIAVATLATDRALLLLGVPGTAKSW